MFLVGITVVFVHVKFPFLIHPLNLLLWPYVFVIVYLNLWVGWEQPPEPVITEGQLGLFPEALLLPVLMF